MSAGTPDRWEPNGTGNPGPERGQQPDLATGSQNPGPANGKPLEGIGVQNLGPASGYDEGRDAGDEPGDDPDEDPQQVHPRAGGEAVAHPREADTPREPDRPAGS